MNDDWLEALLATFFVAFSHLLPPPSKTSSKRPRSLARLTVILTPEKACWVSLPPPLIGRLLDGGAPMPLALDVSVVAADGKGAAASSSAAAFAPLPPQQQRFCVAWGGGATPGGAAPFLGVPASLAALLNIREGATVDVRPLLLRSSDDGGASSSSASSPSPPPAPPRPPPRATRVSVSPASADDWEVIQAQAGLLEESITSQVGVVSVGAPFPVFVPRAGGGGGPVSLVATAIEPSGFPVAFLGPGCEFVVAPVARREEKGKERGDDSSSSGSGGGEAPAAAAAVSWLRVLPSAAARAASLSGARFAPPRAPLPLLLAETGSMPAGKRLATVPSTTAWAPASAVGRLSLPPPSWLSSPTPSASSRSSPLVVVAVSSGLGSSSPRLYLALRASSDDADGKGGEEGGGGGGEGGSGASSPPSSPTFPLPAGHLLLPPPAARAAGVAPGTRAVLRRSPSRPISSLVAGGDAGPSLVILRPDRAAVERRRGGRGESGEEHRRRRQGEEPPPPPPHPVLSTLSAAGPAELAELFSAWLAAQAVASSAGGGGGGAGGGGGGGDRPVVVCDGAIMRLLLVDDGDGWEPASPSPSPSPPPPCLDLAIELRWPGGGRRPGSPVLLSAASALRVELGASAELPPPPGAEGAAPSWPDSEPPPPFGPSWTRTHLRALSGLLRAPLDARARGLLRAAGARPAGDK